MDLSQISTEDLVALKSGDLSKVSTEGLQKIRSGREPVVMPTLADVAKEDVRNLPMSERIPVAMGSAIGQTVEGVKQLFGQGNKQRIEAANAIAKDNPVSNVAGHVMLAAPLAAVPGANTYAGTGVIGALQGLAQPSEADTTSGVIKDKLTNTALGAGTAIGGKYVGGKVADAVNARQAANEVKQSLNATRDATLDEAKQAGYILPKSAVDPSFLTNRLESLAGKAALGQESAIRNQQTTNALARKALGLPGDSPITEGALSRLRNEAAEPYREVAKISPLAESALEKLKDARQQANEYWMHYNRTADPQSLRQARALDSQKEMLEGVIEKLATKSGKPELLQSLRAAREKIAKSYDVEKALNVATSDISAPALGRILDKGGEKRLTGELATIAKFHQAFPAFAREAERVPAAGVGKTEALAGALLGTAGNAAAGPAGLLAAGLPLLSAPTRAALLSRPTQALVRPGYGVGAAALLGRAAAPYAPIAATGMALPQFAQ
jgi:hypothetical protein